MPQIIRDRRKTQRRVERRLSTVAVPADEAPLSRSYAAGATWFTVLAGRLTPQEWRRRLIHMSPGVLAAVLLLLPHTDPLAWYSQVILVIVVLSVTLYSVTHAKLFERTGNSGWSVSVLSYAAISMGLMLAFPGQLEIGMAVTMIIAFGDGCATLAGQIFRGPKLPWNREKSWSGFAAFFLCAAPWATMIYWVESTPAVSFGIALKCVLPGVAIAGLVESLPMRLNDNIRVGMAAGLTILITHGILIGY